MRRFRVTVSRAVPGNLMYEPVKTKTTTVKSVANGQFDRWREKYGSKPDHYIAIDVWMPKRGFWSRVRATDEVTT